MKLSPTNFLITIALLVLSGSCSMFEDQPEQTVDTDTSDTELFEHQAMNAVQQLWDQVAENGSIGGRLGGINSADSVVTDSLEVCGLGYELEEQPQTGGRTKTSNLPKITVTFNSFRCEVPGSVLREGRITYEMLEGNNIGEKNSVSKFTFINFKVTELSTGKSITYNGEKIITNLSGGKLKNLGHCHGNYLDQIADYLHNDEGHDGHGYANDNCDCRLIQRVRSSNFRVTYDNGSELIRNTAKVKVFYKMIFNNYSMYVLPDTTVAGQTKVADWGTLPNGKQFFNIIEEPIVYQSCFRFCKYTEGTKVRKVIHGRETTTIFGVKQNGTEFPNCLAYGKLVYYFNSKGDSIANVIPYY